MILNRPMVRWVCPNCPTVALRPFVVNHQEYHLCKGMKMLTVPLIEEGKKVKITANEREDYIKNEIVQTDGDGRPVMNVTIEREDGQDCVVYAPAAEIKGR